MRTGRKVSIVLSATIFVVLVVWDVWVYIDEGPSSTLSRVWLDHVTGKPWGVAALFFLLGHLAWPQRVVHRIVAYRDDPVTQEIPLTSNREIAEKA